MNKEVKIFIFGNDKIHGGSIRIRTNNFDLALKHFKIVCLFPEEYVDHKCVISYEKDESLDRYIYKFKSNPYINVYIANIRDINDKYNNYDKKKFYKKILLSEVIDVNYESITPLKQIEYDGTSEDSNQLETIKGMIEIPDKDISKFNKQELRRTTDLINSKMSELNAKREELENALKLMKEELDKKLKLLYVLETYLGLKEEVYQLLEGEKTDEDIPISVYQMKLFMDEEVGLIDEDSIDLENIEVFDEWIKKHYKQFLYKTKSICVWQVRRKNKEYSDDPLTNIVMNQGNKITYFLIRNGDNLYRIYSDVKIGDRFFPTKDEYEKILKEGYWWKKEEVQKKHENYMYGMIAVQGLIERTDIFGTNFRHIQLFMPNGFTEKEINLIRDDEPEYYISDRECWNDFVKKNRDNIHQGTRIVICKISHDGYSKDNWRSYPFHPYSNPDEKELFIVEKEREKDKERYHGWDFIFYYKDKSYYEWEKRKRRVPFRVYKDEVLNYDDLKIKDLEYFEKNRYERRNYLSILPVISYTKKLKIKEKELEDNFIKFMQGKYFPEMEMEEMRPYLRWWKLKNKWKRELTKDDAKAVRMIYRKIMKEKIK